MLSICHCFSTRIYLIVFSRGIIFLTTAWIIYIISFIVTLVMKTIVLLWILLRILSILVSRAIVFWNLRTIIIRFCHFGHRGIDLVFRSLIVIYIAGVGANWCIFKLVYEFIDLININRSWVILVKYFKYLHILLPVEAQFILLFIVINNSLCIVLVWTVDTAFHKLCNGVCINKLKSKINNFDNLFI